MQFMTEGAGGGGGGGGLGLVGGALGSLGIARRRDGCLRERALKFLKFSTREIRR